MKLPTRVDEALQNARRFLAAVSESPSLDARLMLAEVMHCEGDWLLAHSESELGVREAEDFATLLARRQQGEALPHILGWWEFFGRKFRIDRSVMIPRPETELLVEEALAYLDRRPRLGLALDVGTGSGCIAVTLALEKPMLRLMATDVSAPALQVARRNAQEHQVSERIDFVRTDLLPPIEGRVDLLCANLPYVSSAELAKLAVGRREPRIALNGGKDGLRLVRRLVMELPQILAPGGRAVLEIGADQGSEVMAAAQDAFPSACVAVRADLAGRDRVVVIDR